MKLTDKEGLEIASVVKDVLEGKAVKKEKKNVKEVEEPRAQGEKEFKKKHVIKKSGENPDGTVTKEASDKKAKYKAFFDAALKKFGVKSPAELEGDKKKEFFNYVDKNYEAQNEVKEGLVDKVKDQLANLKKKKDSGNSEMDDATIMKLANLLQKKGQLAKKAEDHDKRSQQYHDQASDAEDAGDDDRAEDLQMKADDEWDKHTSAMHAIEDIDDQIRDLKDKARNKKEGVNEGLVDTVKQQLANLKKKKDSGNSEMDDATIMKLASLLQKKGQLAQKMEQHQKAAERAADNDDDDRADEEQEKWEEAKFSMDRIDDEIRDLKDKARNKNK